jgi:hypothetical protein
MVMVSVVQVTGGVLMAADSVPYVPDDRPGRGGQAPGGVRAEPHIIGRHRANARAAGFDAHVTKPVDPDTLEDLPGERT